LVDSAHFGKRYPTSSEQQLSADLEGKICSAGGVPEIGAYEYDSSSTNVPTPFVSLYFNKNSDNTISNAGSLVRSTPIAAWSTNIPTSVGAIVR
jgi:hypothetical protein